MTELRADVGHVIELAWADDVSFEAIEAETGLSEKQVIDVMRRSLRPGSFRAWRKRVSGRDAKHGRRSKHMSMVSED
ncbi:MAG: TIGR03643 family protein [Pseudomonadota bacterium]